jgi:hypothetical protein
VVVIFAIYCLFLKSNLATGETALFEAAQAFPK